jgi:hypothetical protein
MKNRVKNPPIPDWNKGGRQQLPWDDHRCISDASDLWHWDWSNWTEVAYRYCVRQWYCSIIPSFPMVSMHNTTIEHWMHRASHHVQNVIQFVVPKFPKLQDHPEFPQLPKALSEFWDHVTNVTTQHHSALNTSDFMLRHFDTNGDGTISRNELLNMTELFHQMMVLMTPPHPHTHISWMAWIHREWPLFDWKLGVFLWRSFGGILLLLAILSIVPGRLHGISAKLLRWPVLGITYCLIGVELVYVISKFNLRFLRLKLFCSRVQFLKRVHCHSAVHSSGRISDCPTKASQFASENGLVQVLSGVVSVRGRTGSLAKARSLVAAN